MRKAKRGLASLLAALALLVLAAAPAAADPPGFNGTVKIHEGATETEPIKHNDPHVCTFHLHGFNFDTGATGTWEIRGWTPSPGRSGTPAAAGSWGPANSDGDWRTGAMTLRPGHYKLFWDQKVPPAPGAEKHKVFWVECEQPTGAEEARAELAAAITSAHTVSGQLATTITTAQNLLSSGTLNAAQAAALSAAVTAASGPAGQLATRITEAQGALTALNAAISSGNTAQIATALTAAQQATTNLSAAATAAAEANVELGAAISASGSASSSGGSNSGGGNAGGAGNAGGSTTGSGGVTSGETATTTIVAGVQTLPTAGQTTPNMVVGGLQTLPSTSTQDDDLGPIAMLGATLIALGGFLLMRARRITI